jgi:hypothetical protein
VDKNVDVDVNVNVNATFDVDLIGAVYADGSTCVGASDGMRSRRRSFAGHRSVNVHDGVHVHVHVKVNV